MIKGLGTVHNSCKSCLTVAFKGEIGKLMFVFVKSDCGQWHL